MLRNIVFMTLGGLIFHSPAFASDDLDLQYQPKPVIPLGENLFSAPQQVSPSEAFIRVQGVLNHFQVPPDPDSDNLLAPLASLKTMDEIRKMLPVMDPSGQFRNYVNLEIQGESAGLHGFQDISSKTVSDFFVPLLKSGEKPAQAEPEFYTHLLQARLNWNGGANRQPLAGLKIALDPGHMGGPFWDDKTGKYVKDQRGNKISEGLIALQTALLLEARLQSLGAQTLVTHRLLQPVTTSQFSDFDLLPFARKTLRESSLNHWFQLLLLTGPAGPSLYSAFEANGEVRKIFSESSRAHYFILSDDLEARARIITDFKPDITLIIHYDTQDPAHDPAGVNAVRFDKTKSYVAGGTTPEEWATRANRALYMRHLLELRSWRSSVKLSSSLVHALHEELGLEYESTDSETTRVIEPGVMGRNLYLTNHVSNTALSYLECLYYNDPKEFDELRRPDHEMTIGDSTYPYSNRLLQVVGALVDGLVAFVSMNGDPL